MTHLINLVLDLVTYETLTIYSYILKICMMLICEPLLRAFEEMTSIGNGQDMICLDTDQVD